MYMYVNVRRHVQIHVQVLYVYEYEIQGHPNRDAEQILRKCAKPHKKILLCKQWQHLFNGAKIQVAADNLGKNQFSNFNIGSSTKIKGAKDFVAPTILVQTCH